MAEVAAGQLDVRTRGQTVAVTVRAVADEQRLPAMGQYFGSQVIRGSHGWPRQPLHTARNLAVEGIEALAPPGIDDRRDPPGREPSREREEIQAGHPDHRDSQSLGDRLP